MTKKIELKAQKRSKEEKNPKELRETGFVPGVIYGQGRDALQLKVEKNELEKVFAEAGESNLVEIKIEGGESKQVIIKSLDRDRVKNQILNVDFFTVDMKEKIEVDVPLDFEGEAPGEKGGGIILKSMDTVSVSCLPSQLLESLKVDMTKLEKIGDVIRVADLEMPKEIELVSSPDDVIVSLSEAKKSEEAEETTEEEAKEEDKKD